MKQNFVAHHEHVPTTHASLAERNVLLRFLETCLRGASQVFFQNNPLTGFFFLAGIFWGAASAGMIQVGIGAVVGLMVGTATAMLLGSDRESLRKGMFGFNAILVGVAVPTFLGNHPMMWGYLVVGAAASHVVMLAISSVLKPYGVAASTGPFVVTTWFLMLGAYSFARTPIVSLGAPALAHATDAAASQVALTPTFLLQTLFRNVSQVFLVKSAITGLLFTIGIAISSVRAAIFAVVGSALAMLVALVLGANGSDLAKGLYGFSPVLTAIALGAVFLRPSWRVTVYALFGTIFTVIVQGGMDVLVLPFGIPTFTMPYVLTMWLFTLPKAGLAPAAHDAPKRDEVHSVFA